MCLMTRQVRAVGRAVAALGTAAALAVSLSAPSSSTEAAPPAPPAPGADGRIAFTEPDPAQPVSVRAPQVWTASPDGSDVHRQFAAIDENNAYPQWSPDGRWLAFYRDNTLMVARADGSEARVIAPGTGIIGAATSWSPDGTRVAYSVEPTPYHGQIWVVNADGSDAHLVHEGFGAGGPSWSPDGTTIAFAQRPPSDGTGNSSARDLAVYLMDADGGDVRRLTGDEGGQYAAFVEDFAPDWSPDGSRIAFVSARDVPDPLCLNCSRYDVYTMKADGTDVLRYPKDGNELRPVWSPSGRSLAYVAMPTPPFNPRTNPVQVDVLDLGTLASRHIAPVQLDGAADWGPVPGSVPEADLVSSFVADAGLVPLASTVRYTAAIRNDGPAPATGAAVEVRLPAGSQYDGATAGCAGTVVVRCDAGLLGVGESRSFSVGTSVGVAGLLETSALATSATADPETANNRSTVPVTVCTQLGGSGADTLLGTVGSDVLCGAGGADTLRGGGGADVLLGGAGDDKVDGGTGTDAASYAQATGGVRASLTRGRSTGEGRDRIRRVENLAGSRFGDRLAGSDRRNVVWGFGGRDRIDGGAGGDSVLAGDGDDRIAPGSGGDSVQGGLGFDVLDYRRASRWVRVDLRSQTARADGADALGSIEGVIGSRYADDLTGSVSGNRLVGGLGDDRLAAAGGEDTVWGGGGQARLAGGDGDDKLVGGAGRDRCRQNFGRGHPSQCERA